MERKASWKDKVIFFLMGIWVAVSLLMLMGAGNVGAMNGRYQIATWATYFSESSGGCGAFVLDTVTGNTKNAYTVVYGNPPSRSVLINNLRKPFHEMR